MPSIAGGAWAAPIQGRRNGSACGGKNSGHFGMGEGEEGADDSGVKLSAAGFVEAAHGFVVGQAFSIGPRRDHGVKGINHADDSGDYRYFGVLQACGIALAIQCFVIMEKIEKLIESADYRIAERS